MFEEEEEEEDDEMNDVLRRQRNTAVTWRSGRCEASGPAVRLTETRRP